MTSCPFLRSRRAILPPIRPSPITAICMLSPSHEPLVYRRGECVESGPDVIEMDSNGASPALVQHFEIADRLRQLHRCEIKVASRQSDFLAMLGRDRDEDAFVRAALVGLSGRVQITRPEARNRRYALGIADSGADGIERGLMRLGLLDIGEQREVIPGAELTEMGA